MNRFLLKAFRVLFDLLFR